VLVVEHNLDVLARADWILDLGPEGGAGGGELVAEGPPQVITAEPRSITGRYLAEYFEHWGQVKAPKRRAKRVAPAKRKTRRR
jgi:excinuclease ABC subunit A